MFIKLMLFSIALIALAFIGLGVQTLFSKRKRFPEFKVGHNKEMRKRKIHCINTQQKIIDKEIKAQNKLKGLCSACSSEGSC